MALLWAVCLTGLMRSTPHPTLAENVRLRLLRVLPDAARVDVFGVFPREDASHAERLHAAWPELRNSTLFYRAPEFKAPPGADTVGVTQYAERFYQQWSKIDACLTLVKQREAEMGVRYDFVLRARSDLYYFIPVSRWLTADPNVIQTGAGLGCTPTDHFGAMPRHLAQMYASAAELTFDRNVTPALLRAQEHMCHCRGDIFPECLIAGWLVLRNVEVRNVCDHEYELWRHTHVLENGTLSDFWSNVLSGPLVEPTGLPWSVPTACSGANGTTTVGPT